eukprot:6095903-Heterocapsa_arctica.AAC.1
MGAEAVARRRGLLGRPSAGDSFQTLPFTMLRCVAPMFLHSSHAEGAVWLQTSTTSMLPGTGPSPSRSSSAAELLACMEVLYLTALLIH